MEVKFQSQQKKSKGVYKIACLLNSLNTYTVQNSGCGIQKKLYLTRSNPHVNSLKRRKICQMIKRWQSNKIEACLFTCTPLISAQLITTNARACDQDAVGVWSSPLRNFFFFFPGVSELFILLLTAFYLLLFCFTHIGFIFSRKWRLFFGGRG